MKKKILMIVTRDFPENSTNGRERTMLSIAEFLDSDFDLQYYRLYSLFEKFSIRRLLSTIIFFFFNVLQFELVPLQCYLFYNPAYKREIKNILRDGGISGLYFDGVRSGIYASLIDLDASVVKVCDFDDLMSRRIRTWRENSVSLSFGYLSKFVPEFFKGIFENKLFSNLYYFYESAALHREEIRQVKLFDYIVLVSSKEADILRMDVDSLYKNKILSIPPYFEVKVKFVPPSCLLHFIFIGSDSQLQNRVSIDFLLSLWTSNEVGVPLKIFGKQSRVYKKTKNVEFVGFVDNISDIYQSGVISLVPSLISGGIKTKIFEALAFGIPVLGTDVAFEGISHERNSSIVSVSDFLSSIERVRNSPHEVFNDNQLLLEKLEKCFSWDATKNSWLQIFN